MKAEEISKLHRVFSAYTVKVEELEAFRKRYQSQDTVKMVLSGTYDEYFIDKNIIESEILTKIKNMKKELEAAGVELPEKT